jgi:ABC-type Zn uptake system ZnuABC Zn-binding protein ZnuA
MLLNNVKIVNLQHGEEIMDFYLAVVSNNLVCKLEEIKNVYIDTLEDPEDITITTLENFIEYVNKNYGNGEVIIEKLEVSESLEFF